MDGARRRYVGFTVKKFPDRLQRNTNTRYGQNPCSSTSGPVNLPSICALKIYFYPAAKNQFYEAVHNAKCRLPQMKWIYLLDEVWAREGTESEAW